MKKIFISFIMLNVALLGFAQPNRISLPTVQINTTGLLVQPPIINMTVTQNANASFNFNFAEDLINGKEIPLFYKIEVNSNIPWVIVVNSDNDFFSSIYMQINNANNNNIPTSIISLKNNTENLYFPISNVYKPIIKGDSTTSSIYYIDMKVNPTWNYSGGIYTTIINFRVMSQ